MNTAGTVLLAGLLVAGGLLAYDATHADGGSVLLVAPPDVPEAQTPDEAPWEELDARLARLERRIAAQRRELASLRSRPRAAAPETSEQRETAFLEPPRRAPDGVLSIAPETLTGLRAYVAEAERRIREDHRRDLVRASIARLDLDLGPEEHDRVLQAVLTYQAKTRTFWTDMRERGITDRQHQLAELDRIRQVLIEAVRPYVQTNELDRVLDGLIGRGAIRPGRPVPRRPWEK